MLHLLRIQRPEYSKVLLLWLMQLVLSTGYSMGIVAIYSMLVKRLGIAYLPYMYIFTSIFGICGSLIYIYFYHLFSQTKLLIYFAIVCEILLFGGYSFIAFHDSESITVTLNLVFFFILIIAAKGIGQSTLPMQVWNISHEILSPEQRGRIYPLVNTGPIIGGISSGILIHFFVPIYGTGFLIIAWSIMTILMIPFALLLKKVSPESISKIDQIFEWKKYSEIIKEKREKGRNLFSTSNFVKMMSIIACTFWIVSSLQDFQYVKILNQTFDTEAKLSLFLGYYGIFINLLSIPILLFFTTKSINRLGVGKSLSALPLTITGGLTLILIKFSFFFGFLMKFSWDIVGMAIQANAFQLSFDAISRPHRSQARAFIEGTVNSTGGFLGGIFCAILQHLSSSVYGNDLFILIAICFTVLWFIVSLQAPKLYFGSICKNLESEDRCSQLESIELLGNHNNLEARSSLLDIFYQEDKQKKLLSLRSLAKIGNEEVVKKLQEYPMDKEDKELIESINQTIKQIQND